MIQPPYLVSPRAGLGVPDCLIAVRSPALPINALLGPLCMLARKATVQWLKGHPDALFHPLHHKSFAMADKRDGDRPSPT